MTKLHAYFILRQQQSFQRLLDGSKGTSNSNSGAGGASTSTSGGKSWNRPSALKSAVVPVCDVNARDWLGRTVLHHACASTDPSSLEFARLLLAHPAIDPNLPDKESHWTALHRALFNGNIAAATLLLKRPDVDTSLRDFEGYTAFDLYNSTLRSTKTPDSDDHLAELFTWGANRNAALGLGDGDDRAFPEQVSIPPQNDTMGSIQVKQIVMSKLHTVVVTSEPRGNIRVCGFGSGGRLGPGHHTQYSLTPIPHLTHTILSVALGQDHTLAVTKSGEVLSWGLNRFAQLGYVIDPLPGNVGVKDEPIQATPRKIIGSLKKEMVVGVAACKTASVCWTEREVFTWGTNHGQLGYDKVAQPIQVLPRKVTIVTQPVINIAITDSAMACLLQNHDVLCLWNDRHSKINFPMHRFPPEIYVYHPPHTIRHNNIAKITSCDDTFAALSSGGEVFTFSVSNLSDGEASRRDRTAIKPQLVWALRKQFSGVRDVALGADGSLVVATQSGHVFVRSRNAKTFKFHRVPYLQRVTKVCANNTGAFGALRVDYQPEEIRLSGMTAGQHMAAVQPYLVLPPGAEEEYTTRVVVDIDDPSVEQDIQHLERLCKVLILDRQRRRKPNGHGLFDGGRFAHGADVLVQSASGIEVPTHRVWLAARSSVLLELFSATKCVQDSVSKISIRLSDAKEPLPRLVFAGCQSLSILITLFFLYSDQFLCLWDPRVATALDEPLRNLTVKTHQVQFEVQSLARILNLPMLANAAQFPTKRTVQPTIPADMHRLASDMQLSGLALMRANEMVKSPLRPDTIIQLRDRDYLCHSVVLRARCPLLAGFFDDKDWTIQRWDEYGTLKIDMRHLDWRVMKVVVQFLCGGDENSDVLFGDLSSASNNDEVLDFMFDVIAAANELLLDRLISICSIALLKHLDVNNSCYMLADATHFHAEDLMRAIHAHMAANMETLLESRMLDDLQPHMIRQLGDFVRKSQAQKFAITRSNQIYDRALAKHADWLALQDIPGPVPRTSGITDFKLSPKLSPSELRRKTSRLSAGSPASSPIIRPLSTAQAGPVARLPSGDEVFLMDDADIHPSTPLLEPSLLPSDASPRSAPAWKRGHTTPKVDMKSIMAEAESTRTTELTFGPVYRVPSLEKPTQRSTPKSNQQANQSTSHPPAVLVSSSTHSSPWKLPSGPTASPTGFPTLGSPAVTPLTSTTPIGTPPSRTNFPRPSENRCPATPPSATKSLLTTSRYLSSSQASRSDLGPVFVPSRQPLSTSKAGSSLGRKVSGPGAAWTLPSVEPVVEPTPSTTGRAPSFAAIQKLQLDEGVSTVPDKRSLREIQEEEQARQAEADFLKWWAAEEERVKLEEAQMLESIGQGESRRSTKTSKKKKPSPTLPEGEIEHHIRLEGQQSNRRNAKKQTRKPVS